MSSGSAQERLEMAAAGISTPPQLHTPATTHQGHSLHSHAHFCCSWLSTVCALAFLGNKGGYAEEFSAIAHGPCEDFTTCHQVGFGAFATAPTAFLCASAGGRAARPPPPHRVVAAAARAGGHVSVRVRGPCRARHTRNQPVCAQPTLCTALDWVVMSLAATCASVALLLTLTLVFSPSVVLLSTMTPCFVSL
eukprot:6176846-Pleurochrysis_carterae.AAC.2